MGDEATIRVVDVRKAQIDITTAQIEEISVAINQVTSEDPALGRMRNELRGTITIAEQTQGLIRVFMNAGPSMLLEIMSRNVITHPSFLPVINRARTTQQKTNLRARPPTRVRAILIDGSDAAVGAEESVELIGIAVDASAGGNLILDTFAGSINRGTEALLESGTGGPVLGAVGSFEGSSSGREAFPNQMPRFHPQHQGKKGALETKLMKNGFVYIALGSREDAAPMIEHLFRQASNAVEYQLGAGVAAVASAAEVARKGQKANPVLASLIGPRRKTLGTVAPPKEEHATPPRTLKDEQLAYLLGRLGKTRVVVKSAREPDYYLSPLFDLFRTGALDIYLYLLIDGRESPEVDRFLEREASLSAKRSQLAALERTSLARAVKARQYLLIVEDKLGKTRLESLISDIGSKLVTGLRGQGAPGRGGDGWVKDTARVNDPELVLSILTPREREIVKTDYENRLAEWAAQVGNKCPHLGIYRRMLRATTAQEAADTLAKLKPYIDPRTDVGPPAGKHQEKTSAGKHQEKTPTAWVDCRNCGFHLICPHLREKILMEARRASYEEIRTRLQKYAVRYTTETTEANSYVYFCRICGQRTAEMIEEDRTAEFQGKYGSLDESLKTLIWAETANSAKMLRFPVPTDPRQYASAAVDILYPLVMAAEESINKKGRRKLARVTPSEDGEDIDPRTHLYAVLFVYAYGLNLIQNSQEVRGNEIGFAGVAPRAKISEYAEAILTHISESHRGIVAQIEDISAEYIAGRFKEAFRMVRGDNADMRIKPVNAEEELAVQLTQFDPMYHYAVSIAKIAGVLPIRRANSPADAKREFETAMGAPLTRIIKDARDHSRVPSLAALYSKRMVLEVPPGTTLEYLSKDPRVNLMASIYPGPKLDKSKVDRFMDLGSTIAGIKYTGLQTWMGGAHKPAQTSRRPNTYRRSNPFLAPYAYGYCMESYRLFVEYSTKLTDNAALRRFQEQFQKLREAERGYFMIKAVFALKTYYSFGFKHSRRFQLIDTKLGYLYDENGLRHEWTIFVYSAGSSAPPLEVKAKDILAMREKGTLSHEYDLVDVKCAICGILRTNVGSVDSQKAERSLRVNSNIEMFFSFYESRCPEGNLHDWSGDSACRKCGLHKELYLAQKTDPMARRTPEARAYYDKYEAHFDKDRGIIASPDTFTALAEPAPPDTAGNAAAAEWKYDYGVVLQAAELVGTSVYAIEALGATEGRDYADVLEGKNMPPPPYQMSDPRLLTADSAVRLFAAKYNLLKYVSRSTKPSIQTIELLDKANVPKHEYELLLHQLPDILGDYRARLAAMKRVRTPAEVLQFIIEYLCRMVMTLADMGKKVESSPVATRVATVYAVNELTLILRGEKLLSKAGTFNFSIFFDEPDTVDMGSDVGEAGEDALPDQDRAAQEVDGTFSYEGMDYSGENEEESEYPSQETSLD